jgi:hypothetical protein
MKNNLNLIILVTSLFFFPLFAEGKSTEKKSFIQQIKEKITKEVEKVEGKSKEKEKAEDKVVVKEKEKEKEKEKGKDTYEHKDKDQKKEPAEEKSRIEIVKEKIVKEQKKIEDKVVVKKEEKKKEKDKDKNKDKDKHDPVYKKDDRNNHEYDYTHNNGYNKERDKHNDDVDFLRGYGYRYDGVSFPLTTVEYVDYTYVNDPDIDVYSSIDTDNHPRKIASLSSSVEAAYLGKDIRDTYGATAKISANLYSLHFNCFYQNIFSSEETLTVYSINGGVSFPIYNFTFTPFIGAFYIEPLEEARFSYGADLQVSFPGNYILDLYTLNSSYGSLNFNNFSASLNYAFSIFNIGLGYNYNNYAGISFSGPFARLSLGF